MERGGFYYSNSMGGWGGIDFNYLRGGMHASRPGGRVVGMAEVGYEVEKGGSFDLMFVWNANPLHSLPGADRIREAVEEGRLRLVVHDPHWSETAKLANVVLPAPTFLEKVDVIYSYWHEYLILSEPPREAHWDSGDGVGEGGGGAAGVGGVASIDRGGSNARRRRGNTGGNRGGHAGGVDGEEGGSYKA